MGKKVKVVVAQSCPTLFDSMDISLPGSFVHGILQTRKLEWEVPFSRGSSPPRVQTQVSCIADGFFTVWATREAHDLGCQLSNDSCPEHDHQDSCKSKYSVNVKNIPEKCKYAHIYFKWSGSVLSCPVNLLSENCPISPSTSKMSLRSHVYLEEQTLFFI